MCYLPHGMWVSHAHPQYTCDLKHHAVNRGLDLYGLSCREPKHCHRLHFIFFLLESGPGHVAGQWALRGRWLGQEDVAELRPRSFPGMVFPLSLLSCRSREGGPSCTATGVRYPFLGGPPDVFYSVPPLPPACWGAVSTGWSCPLTPTGLPHGTHSAFANSQNVFHKMYVSLKLHLYICLFFIFKTCFLDKFINILAGALSPCKSLSPTHVPTLPARLHSCFSTCSSHVGDPVVVCLPHSPLALSQSLALSLPSSLFSLSFPSSLIHSSALSVPLQRVRTHFTPLQMSRLSIHFTAIVSQGDSLCSVLTQIVMTTFISLIGWWILVTLESIWHLLWGEHLRTLG